MTSSEHINKNAYNFVLDAATGKPLMRAPETPVPQSAAAHTYPTQPIPETSDELVPHVPFDTQKYQGVLAPDGKPFIISTVPYQPYTDQQYVVIAPTAGGGVEWPMGSWDPVRGVEVVCANAQMTGYESPPAADQHPVISNAGQIIQLRSVVCARLVDDQPAGRVQPGDQHDRVEDRQRLDRRNRGRELGTVREPGDDDRERALDHRPHRRHTAGTRTASR